MTDRTSLVLGDDRKRLEDRVRAAVNDKDQILPAVNWRTTLYDMALTHLLESIQTMRGSNVDPEDKKLASTTILHPHYRKETKDGEVVDYKEWLEIRRAN